MSRLSTRLWAVIGLSAVLSSTACMDQSGEEINQAPQQKTGQERASDKEGVNEIQPPASAPVSDKEGVNEIQPPASAPVAANEEVSEEERQELESWMDEKLREGQEQEAEAGKQGE